VEAPHLKELHEKYGSKGLKILAVDAWNEPKEVVAKFAKSLDLPYTILVNGGQVCQEKYKCKSIPRNFLLDSDGNVVTELTGDGPVQRKAMIRKIEALLQ
jgi:thiol-disulfide isomerase/thioredoxin